MGNPKSIKKNMIWNTILTMSNFIFPLITYPYVTRVLLPEGTGKINFVQSALSIFSYLASLGISGYGTRECAKVRDDKEKLSKLVQEIFIINFTATFVAYIALIISLIAIPKFQDYRVLFAVMCIQMLLTTLGVEWLYQALEMYTYIMIRSLILKILSVILIFLCVRDPSDYIIYGALTIFSTSASNVFNFFNLRKYISFRKYPSYLLKKHMRPIFTFFFSMIAITIYNQMDSLMLGFMKGDVAVGVYGASVKIKSVILSLVVSVSSVLTPRMTIYISHNQRKDYTRLLAKSVKLSLVLIWPLAFFVILNATDVIHLACGEAYLNAKQPLIVLMMCILAITITNILGNQILIPKNMEARYSQSVFIGLFLNILCNFLLIPSMNYTGAALATLLTELFNIFWMGVVCKDEIHAISGQLSKRLYFPALAISILCMVFVKQFTLSLPLFWRLTFHAITLFVSYYGILWIRQEEILMLGIHMIKKRIGA